MPMPSREAIETYMSVTGASESVAVRRLEEHGGNVSEAVNSHFGGGLQHPSVNPPPTGYPLYNNSMDGSYQGNGGQQGATPLLDVVRSFKPSSLLDPDYRRYFLNQIGLSQLNSPSLPSDPYAGNRMGAAEASYPSYVQPYELGSRPAVDGAGRPGSVVYGFPADHGRRDEDIEEEMMRTAIEASRQEALMNARHGLPVTWSSTEVDERPVISEDEQLNRAISLSLMEAEREAEKHKHLGSSFSQDRAASSNEQRKTDMLCHPDTSSHSKDTKISKNTEETVEAREVVLSNEPAIDDEGAISVVVRMPDGSRHGRRFLVTDKIKSVFNFVDLGGWAKPSSYKLVRPYPREAFTAADSSSSLGELGITNKQEALFLEFL
ncbi:hypothetical protein MLD38_019751 [Melastoma candidum]|uniref:Uncharacterized protein n=1 Tax=Melastoma candidum TaxID=119954 RepID=A0ACB9QXZ3_9MYRT|nr:hypothetical protein MLD38_019751 [Melastoma candidum]